MNSNPDIVAAAEEQAAQPVQKSANATLFAYDEKYARERKTYGQPYHRYFGLFAIILAGCAIWFLGQQFVPKQSGISNAVFYLGAFCWLFAIFIYPKLPGYKLDAWFKSFYDGDGKLYAFSFTPYKDSRSNVRQNLHNAGCFEACHDESLIFSLLDDYRMGVALQKGDRYRRVKIIPMSDVTVLKKGKRSTVSYTDQNGKARKMTVADCYPGLFEHIESSGK